MIYNYTIHKKVAKFETKIVDTLPSKDDAALDAIYFVKDSEETTNNSYVEYLCIEKEDGTRSWERIGTTADVYTKNETAKLDAVVLAESQQYTDTQVTDCVKKTEIKPLYVHNIILHYKHLNYPGDEDGECRASFVLTNTEATPYTLSANDATTAANYDARYDLLRLFRAIISETNAPTGLSELASQESKNHLVPCSGVTIAPLTEGSSPSFCVNHRVGAKYFNFSDVGLKRLLIVYGYPITASELTADAGY